MQEVYNKLKDQWDAFEENHEKHTTTGNKSAGARARKALGEIKKMVTEYRKLSVQASKDD
jgi:hypothetical protein